MRVFSREGVGGMVVVAGVVVACVARSVRCVISSRMTVFLLAVRLPCVIGSRIAVFLPGGFLRSKGFIVCRWAVVGRMSLVSGAALGRQDSRFDIHPAFLATMPLVAGCSTVPAALRSCRRAPGR